MQDGSRNSVPDLSSSLSPSSFSLIDTHCHLEMTAFDPDRESVIQRARDAGLEAMHYHRLGHLKEMSADLNSQDNTTSFIPQSVSILMMQKISQTTYSER